MTKAWHVVSNLSLAAENKINCEPITFASTEAKILMIMPDHLDERQSPVTSVAHN